MSADPPPPPEEPGNVLERLFCADCGYQLKPLTRAQERWALRTGRIPRPPCPASDGGLHRLPDVVEPRPAGTA